MEIREATPVELALDAWSTALDHLVKVVDDGGLDGVDDLGLVSFVQGVERVRNRTALVDHRVIRDAETRRLPDTLTQPSMTAVLAWALRISHADAARRVRAADALGERVSTTGEPLPPSRPALAAVQRDGDLGPEQADLCLRALATVDRRGFDPAEIDRAEELLAGFAVTFPPAELRRLAARVVDRIDPDGTLPDDQLAADRRHLALRRLRDGTYLLDGRLTGDVGAKLRTVLSPLAAPRVEQVAGEADPRHYGQRLHDALDESCDRLLRSGTLPDAGGIPTTLIVTVTQHDLQTRSGHGTTTDGDLLTIDTVLRLADQADLVGVQISSTGAVLDLGRTRRCASPAQTLALTARDRGCSFPGCTRPPAWCERHHIRPWVDGGATDLDNLTLLCGYHHRHFAGRGWTCTMRDGLPAWTPPAWIDPRRRPLVNTRITTGHLRC